MEERGRLSTLLYLLRPRTLRLLWRGLDDLDVARSGTLTLKVMDLRPKDSYDPPALVLIVSRALNQLSLAGQGCAGLVVDHVQRVVAADRIRTLAIKQAEYWDNFTSHEARNPHYLACQLLWAATAIRLYRDGLASHKRPERRLVREACWAAQKRFLEQFPDAEEWIAYMNPERPAA